MSWHDTVWTRCVLRHGLHGDAVFHNNTCRKTTRFAAHIESICTLVGHVYYTKRFLHYVHRIFSAYIYAKISRFEVKIVRLLVNKQLWVTGVVLVLDMGGRHCSVETGPQSAEPLINEISPCLPKVSRTFAEGQAA